QQARVYRVVYVLFSVRRARTIGLMVPLQLLAFYVLYIATARLWISEVVSIADETASEQLQAATAELSEIAVAHTQNRALKHFFEAVLVRHQDIALKLILPNGQTLGSNRGPAQSELDELRSLLAAEQIQQTWLSEEGKQQIVRGLAKVVSTEQCSRCHAQGETLAVASMSLDVTRMLDRIRARSRQSLAWLIAAWAVALGATTSIVQHTVRKSASRLEADLAAAEAGDVGPSQPRSSELILDRDTAELHRSFRDFLTRQKRRRAEEASRLAHTDQLASLGQLAAGLAHEIKNPLAGIHGALEILREDSSANQSNAELYDEMISELDRVNDTLQSLLRSARPSTVRLAKVDLTQLIREVHKLMAPGLRRQEVRLELDIETEALEVQADSAKMRQVLINLVQNAADAMADGGGTVTIRATRLPGEVGGTIVAVQDNGPGIPEDQLGKIFEPFFTTKFTGTGLGLAIARSLVEQHGGSLEVESTAGQGTTFYIVLPTTDDGHANGDTDRMAVET
ncbi:MAG: ATP-binding protein, partial [Acidobacteriota bacterium]